MWSFILFTLMASGAALDFSPTGRAKRGRRPSPLEDRDRLQPILSPDGSIRTFDGPIIRPPRRKQLNPRELKTTLGNDFQAEWMAVDRPRSLVVEPDEDQLPSTDNNVWTEVRRLNFTQILKSSDEATVMAVQKWLLVRASCAVRYVWEDVGPLFWPRWIKKGQCVNLDARPCSWPAGMHCVPAESALLHVLRWQCRTTPTALPSLLAHHRRSVKRPTVDHSALKCQWVKVPYPITDKCFCSC